MESDTKVEASSAAGNVAAEFDTQIGARNDVQKQPKRPTFRQVAQVVFLLLERPQLGDRRQSKAKRLKTSNFEKDCQRMTIMMGPVTTALALTVVYVKALGLRPEGSEPFQPLLPRPHVDTTQPLGMQFLDGLANAGLMTALVIVSTYLFMLLYHYREKRMLYMILDLIIGGYFFLSTGGFTLYLLFSLETCGWPRAEQDPNVTTAMGTRLWPASLPLDWVMACFVSLNVAAGGTLIVFFIDRKGRSFCHHVFLIYFCVTVTWPFACFSEWTVWTTLVMITLWDIFAVVTPKIGPLRAVMLLEQKRCREGNWHSLPPSILYEHHLFRLGTGDFIFFGVLTARAGMDPFFLVYLLPGIGIIAGIVLIVIVTIFTGLTQPALPFSMLFGILIYVGTVNLLQPHLQHTVEWTSVL